MLCKKSGFKILAIVVTLMMLCISVAGAASKEQKRQHIRAISNNTLQKLYELKPAARTYVENAAGYAVFGNWGV